MPPRKKLLRKRTKVVKTPTPPVRFKESTVEQKNEPVRRNLPPRTIWTRQQQKVLFHLLMVRPPGVENGEVHEVLVMGDDVPPALHVGMPPREIGGEVAYRANEVALSELLYLSIPAKPEDVPIMEETKGGSVVFTTFVVEMVQPPTPPPVQGMFAARGRPYRASRTLRLWIAYSVRTVTNEYATIPLSRSALARIVEIVRSSAHTAPGVRSSRTTADALDAFMNASMTVEIQRTLEEEFDDLFLSGLMTSMTRARAGEYRSEWIRSIAPEGRKVSDAFKDAVVLFILYTANPLFRYRMNGGWIRPGATSLPWLMDGYSELVQDRTFVRTLSTNVDERAISLAHEALGARNASLRTNDVLHYFPDERYRYAPERYLFLQMGEDLVPIGTAVQADGDARSVYFETPYGDQGVLADRVSPDTNLYAFTLMYLRDLLDVGGDKKEEPYTVSAIENET